MPSGDGFPWKQLGVLAICRLAEPIAFCSITAYSFIMVKEIHGPKDASFYSGLLISAFALAEACTAWIWGGLSDKYGRRPIIYVALAGTVVSSLLFGFSKNYWIALAARVAGGLLNGNVAVMQTMVAEMVHKPEHEPKAYAMQPFMWALGSIAGSALGGFTARPADSYPDLFSKDGIWGRYPYALPNVIAASLVLIALIQGLVFLEETNPAMTGLQDEAVDDNEALDETTPLVRSVSRRSARRKSNDGHEDEVYSIVDTPFPIEPILDVRRFSVASDGSLTTARKALAEQRQRRDRGQANTFESAPKTVFTRQVSLWILALWLLCYHQMVYGSLLPVYFLDLPRQRPGHLDLVGGLGYTLPEVGTMLAINCVISLVVQGLIFPTYVARLGNWWTVVSLTFLTPVAYTAVPFSSLFQDPRIGSYIVMILQNLTTVMSYPVILILIKDACPSPLVLGRINGVAMSGCSAARTMAPPIAGAIYGAAGSAAAWWSCGAVGIFCLLELIPLARLRSKDTEELGSASDTEEVA